MVEGKKRNFEKKVVDFMIRVSLTPMSCREIESLEKN